MDSCLERPPVFACNGSIKIRINIDCIAGFNKDSFICLSEIALFVAKQREPARDICSKLDSRCGLIRRVARRTSASTRSPMAWFVLVRTARARVRATAVGLCRRRWTANGPSTASRRTACSVPVPHIRVFTPGSPLTTPGSGTLLHH